MLQCHHLLSMSLLSLGINHQTAPVNVREKVAFSGDQVGLALRELQALSMVRESVIVSTCNRTEIYCDIEVDTAQAISHWLSQYHGMSDDALLPYLYQHTGVEAARHLFRVACGLDSMVLGEPQILGQLKACFDQAQNSKSVDAILNRLFQQSFSVAKRVRTDTEIGNHAVSVAFAAVSLSKQIFGSLSTLQALLIGAGQTIELVARHLKSRKIGSMVIANRNLDNAQRLADGLGASAIRINQVPEQLVDADIVISSTASQLPILGKGATENALRQRRHRPIFMVDLAVPRDIESQVADLDDIYLYTIDDLKNVVDANLRSRELAAEAAREIISLEVKAFDQWLCTHQSADHIRHLRQGAEAIKQQCIEKILLQFRQDHNTEQAIERLANTLTNKFLHGPTIAMRQALKNKDEKMIRFLQSLMPSD